MSYVKKGNFHFKYLIDLRQDKLKNNYVIKKHLKKMLNELNLFRL